MPVTSNVSVAPDLKLTAVRIAPLTVMPEVPANAPEAAVSVPAETRVAPEKVLAPESVRLPAPAWFTLPVPLIALLTVKAFERLKESVELSTTPPEPSVPVVAPAPTCKVPAEIVRVPVKELDPSKIRVPVVVLLIAAPPLISATFFSVPACRFKVPEPDPTAAPAAPILKPPISRAPPLSVMVVFCVPVVEARVIFPAIVNVPPVRLRVPVDTAEAALAPERLMVVALTEPAEMFNVAVAPPVAPEAVLAAIVTAPSEAVPPPIFTVAASAPVVLVPLRLAKLREETLSEPVSNEKFPEPGPLPLEPEERNAKLIAERFTVAE